MLIVIGTLLYLAVFSVLLIFLHSAPAEVGVQELSEDYFTLSNITIRYGLVHGFVVPLVASATTSRGFGAYRHDSDTSVCRLGQGHIS